MRQPAWRDGFQLQGIHLLLFGLRELEYLHRQLRRIDCVKLSAAKRSLESKRMKNIAIEVPTGGVSVQLVLRAGASPGQAVIVVSDDVEIRVAEAAPGIANGSKVPPRSASKSETTAKDPDAILKRLQKLKVATRGAAVNSIKAMFQFDAPINDEAANTLLEDLVGRGGLSIDANGKIRFSKM